MFPQCNMYVIARGVNTHVPMAGAITQENGLKFDRTILDVGFTILIGACIVLPRALSMPMGFPAMLQAQSLKTSQMT